MCLPYQYYLKQAEEKDDPKSVKQKIVSCIKHAMSVKQLNPSIKAVSQSHHPTLHSCLCLAYIGCSHRDNPITACRRNVTHQFSLVISCNFFII